MTNIENSFSPKTVHRELHKSGVHTSTAIRKPQLSKINERFKAFSLEYKLTEFIPRVVDEYYFFRMSHHLLYFRPTDEYIWGSSQRRHLPQTVLFQLLNTQKDLRSSVRVVLYPMDSFHGRISSEYNLSIVSAKMHPMIARMFPSEDTLFQDKKNVPIHKAKVATEWHVVHCSEVKILSGTTVHRFQYR